jgi:hypothetical protein
MPKLCPSCGNQNEENAQFCDNCGATLAAGAVPGGAPVAPPYTGGAAAPVGGGIICPSCGTANLAGTLFCDNCGAALSGVAPQSGGPSYIPAQQPPVSPSVPPVQRPNAPAQPQGGTPQLPCRLVINGQAVIVPVKAEVVIGRADLASGWNPDVDLTPFGGTPEAGVSRKHLKIVWQGAWMVEDMNSVNGTFLRSQRLVPSQRTSINNGEILQLGKLQITFYAQ